MQLILTATETVSDLVGPIDAQSAPRLEPAARIGAVTDALMSGGGALSAEVSAALPSAADLELFDPAFWQEFWVALLHPNAGESPLLLLMGAIEQLPVIGPLLELFGLFVVFPVSLLGAYLWSLISSGVAAAADGLAIGLQGVDGTALAGVIDPALAAEVSTPLGDVAPLFSDAAGVLDPTTLVQDVSTALDLSASTSVLDLSPIADIGTAVDPAAVVDIGAVVDPAAVVDIGAVVDPAVVADIGTVIDPAAIADLGTVLSTSTIPDLGEILTSLMP